MNGKRKTRPDDERAIGAPVPGGGLTDYRPQEVSRPLGPRGNKPKRKLKSIGRPVPKKKG